MDNVTLELSLDEIRFLFRLTQDTPLSVNGKNIVAVAALVTGIQQKLVDALEPKSESQPIHARENGAG